MTKVDFDEYAERYDELLSEKTKFFSDDLSYFSKYKAKVASEILPISRINALLEFGCGTGRNIPYLQKYFPRAVVSGSDISEASINIAKEASPDTRFYLETGISDDIGKFDLIFVAGVFHHIEVNKRLQTMADLYERLNHDGYIFVFEHNPYNPITRRIVSNCEYDLDAVLLRPAELLGYFSKIGLVEINRGFSLFFPPFLGSKFHLVERFMSWMPLGGQYWAMGRKK
jgi:SAM-dependent methyltransferase